MVVSSTVIFALLLQLTKSCQDTELSLLVATRNFLEASQDFVLNLVLSEDLYWPEHLLYLICYFWSKCRACQQIEDTRKEMSNALNFFIGRPITAEDLRGDVEMQLLVDPATVKIYMEPFLPHIRLLIIDAPKLQAILQKYFCFTQAEKCFIYSSFVDCNFAYLPKEFCNLRTPRTHPIQSVYIFGYVEGETENLSSGELFYQSCTSEQFTTKLSSTLFLTQVVVRVPTQIKPPGNASAEYEESFSVILTNYWQFEHITGPLTQKVKYSSSMDINVFPPKNFHAGKGELSVTVLYHKSGLYPTYKPKITTFSNAIDASKEWLSADFKKPYPPI
jgi:hypothetical protein